MQTATPFLTVYFDDHCNLCCTLVSFLLKRKTRRRIVFKPLSEIPFENENLPDSLIAEKGGKWYQKSEAVFEIIAALSSFWRMFGALRMLPLRWRDGVYDFISHHRFKWFGRRYVSCALT